MTRSSRTAGAAARHPAGGGHAARRAARAGCGAATTRGAPRAARAGARAAGGAAHDGARSVDELDARAIELTARRDTVRAALERLPAPRPRRLGRGGDPHLVERTELSSTLGGLEVQLERTLTDRAALTRQLGDVGAIKDERDGLARAVATARRDHGRLLDYLVDRELDARPGWLRDALGEPPDRPSDARRWDRAARVLARYRIEYEFAGGDGGPLGPEPAGGEQRRDFERAQRARDDLVRDSAGKRTATSWAARDHSCPPAKMIEKRRSTPLIPAIARYA